MFSQNRFSNVFKTSNQDFPKTSKLFG